MKHIQVCYFFKEDWVATGNVELKHCLTTTMMADHSTEPLQEELFQRFREDQMNISEDTNMTEMGWYGTEM